MIKIIELAERMNLSHQRIPQLINECKRYASIKKIKPKRGYVDEVEFFLAYIKLLQDKHDKELKNESELEQANIRIKKAAAEKAERDNKKENEELLPRDFVIQFIQTSFGNVRNKLLGSPNKIAYQVFGSKHLTDAKIKTKEIILDVLNELADPKKLFKNGKE